MKLKGSDIIVETLIEQGVDVVFGYPGGSVIEIYDSLFEHSDKIKHFLTVDEQGAAFAAEGYAKSTGKVGVVIATSGPGATNLVTGIADAYIDSVPTVFITGNVGTSLIGKDSFQEIYITGITMSITKHNFVVRKMDELADTIRDAFRIANSGRKGPVLVDIPKDMTIDFAEFENENPYEIKVEKYRNHGMIEEVAKIINSAKKPLIYSGGGIILANSTDELREFIEKTSIPACNTIMGKGILDDDNPLHIGMVGMHGKTSCNLAIENCDVLIAAGVRFSERVALDRHNFAPNAKIIHIDIDASEINKNVLVDYSIVGDVKDVLEQLSPHVEKLDIEQWLQDISKWQAHDYIPVDDKTTIKPHQLMKVLSDNIGRDAIITTDVGQHQMWTAQYASISKARKFITSGGLGTMGFGYCAAIGAKIANPENTVVHITGDGSFQMNMNECITAVRYGVKVISIILNNSSLGMVRQWQHHFYKDKYSETDLLNDVDYVGFAKSMGAKGYKCTTIDEFEKVLKEVLQNNDSVVIIDCVIGRDERALPLIPSGGSVKNMICE